MSKRTTSRYIFAQDEAFRLVKDESPSVFGRTTTRKPVNSTVGTTILTTASTTALTPTLAPTTSSSSSSTTTSSTSLLSSKTSLTSLLPIDNVRIIVRSCTAHIKRSCLFKWQQQHKVLKEINAVRKQAEQMKSDQFLKSDGECLLTMSGYAWRFGDKRTKMLDIFGGVSLPNVIFFTQYPSNSVIIREISSTGEIDRENVWLPHHQTLMKTADEMRCSAWPPSLSPLFHLPDNTLIWMHTSSETHRFQPSTAATSTATSTPQLPIQTIRQGSRLLNGSNRSIKNHIDDILSQCDQPQSALVVISIQYNNPSSSNTSNATTTRIIKLCRMLRYIFIIIIVLMFLLVTGIFISIDSCLLPWQQGCDRMII